MKLSRNVSVNYNEGLFYVDFKNIYMYHKKDNPSQIVLEKDLPDNAQEQTKYKFDAPMSQANFEAFKTKFVDQITTQFPSMQPTDEWLNKSKTRHVIMTNKLFNVVIENNNWSLAIELTMAPKGNTGLQAQMFPSFIKGIRTALLNQFDTIYVRNGSWDAIPITKNSPDDLGNIVISSIDINEDDTEDIEGSFIPEFELLPEM